MPLCIMQVYTHSLGVNSKATCMHILCNQEVFLCRVYIPPGVEDKQEDKLLKHYQTII